MPKPEIRFFECTPVGLTTPAYLDVFIKNRYALSFRQEFAEVAYFASLHRMTCAKAIKFNIFAKYEEVFPDA